MKNGGEDCSGFEPQNYLRDRCKKCFRFKAKHNNNNNTVTNANTVDVVAKSSFSTVSTVSVTTTTTNGIKSTMTGSARRPASHCAPSTSNEAAAALSAIPLNGTVSASRVSTIAAADNNNNNNSSGKSNNSIDNNTATTIFVQNYNGNNTCSVNAGTSKANSDSNSAKSTRNLLATVNAPVMTSSLIMTNNTNVGVNKNRPKSMSSSASIDNIVNNNVVKSSASFGKKERRRSWRNNTANISINRDEPSECNADYDDAADSISLASYKTANSKGVSSTKSMESINSTMDSRSMVTAMSGGSTNEDDRAITPTTDGAEPSDRDIASIRKENMRLQDQVQRLKEERERWTRLRRRSRGNLEVGGGSNTADAAEERLAEAENLLQEYRNENSLLKSELRSIQETIIPSEKLQATERKCDELTQRNAELQRNIDELQQEIEEMQDQYREEEIDEFRELQRELEQNAKNCRILQFKLRKSDRQRDQLQAEKNVFAAKLRELQQQSGAISFNAGCSAAQLSTQKFAQGSQQQPADTNATRDSARIRELESELRIAKEVSVRLHNELEAAEDKRYKLEDEIFYYKEKLREMQTQNKWRETRNKTEKNLKKSSDDIAEDAGTPTTTGTGAADDDASKALRDVLERETDLREQLKFAEEDLHRTQMRLREAENENEELMQKFVGLTEGKNILAQVNSTSTTTKTRGGMMRSFSEDSQSNARMPATRAFTDYNNKPYRSFAGVEKKNGQTSFGNKISANGSNESFEMEKDIAKLLATIQELEHKNGELRIQLQRAEAKLVVATTAVAAQAQQHSSTGAGDSRGLAVELRKEQEQRRELAAELVEYKQLVAKSDNNKLIIMATKVEILSNQLKALNERCETLHKKALKDVKDDKYTETLKLRCETLERELSELKAKRILQPDHSTSKAPTADEIEQCCALLASVDAQSARISKQLEKMDASQKEERRRSLSKDTYAIVVADLANVMAELKILHKLLEAHKDYSKTQAANNSGDASGTRDSSSAAGSDGDTTNAGGQQVESAVARENAVAVSARKTSCDDCVEKTAAIEAQRDEIAFYKKKNKELTNQILQTEDRWTAEIERQGADNQTKIDKLKAEIKQLRSNLREQTQIAEIQTRAFSEKEKLAEEAQMKLRQVETELVEKQRAVQELEKEQRALKEWEIRHKKLESIYDKEKQKFDAEKARIKTETNALKKRTEDALAELTRLRDGHQRREILWTEERSRLENEIAQLKGRVTQNRDASPAAFASNNNIDEHTCAVPIRTVTYRTAAVAAVAKSDAKNEEQIERLRQKCSALEKRNEESEHHLQTARAANARLEAELTENRQIWQRERDTVTHKSRQDEKIRGVEIEALQQKFTSRMNIIETSNKSLHTQLVQTRRERDALRESVASYELKLKDQLKVTESERTKHASSFGKLADVEKQLDEALAAIQQLSGELALAKDTHRADKTLWAIEKERLEVAAVGGVKPNDNDRERIAENALKAAEDVQRQYVEYQKFYNKEVNRLKTKVKELNNELITKESEFQRKAKELSEQIKILDIDQKNLVQVKEMQAGMRDAMQVEQARLVQQLQQHEVYRISRRYRIASIVGQLNVIVEKCTSSYRGTVRQQQQDSSVVQLINIINQLNALKENDGVVQGQCPTAIGETLSETDTNAPSDTISQGSASIRSTPRVNPAMPAGKDYLTQAAFGTLTGSQRSGSVESNTTWDSRLLDYTARSVSPTKRVLCAMDASCSMAASCGTFSNKTKIAPNYFSRMGSSVHQDNRYGSTSTVGSGAGALSTTTRLNLRHMNSMHALFSSGGDNDANSEYGNENTVSHARMNSTGTNVLYKIRRQELAKGTSPSVRSMARAFENINTVKTPQKASPAAQLRGFFSIRKSRSVDNEAKRQKEFERSATTAMSPVPGALSREAAASVARITANAHTVINKDPEDGGTLQHELSASYTATLPRGGRNPFKNMGAKIVERVRRSLSRSSRRDDSVEPMQSRRDATPTAPIVAGDNDAQVDRQGVDNVK